MKARYCDCGEPLTLPYTDQCGPCQQSDHTPLWRGRPVDTNLPTVISSELARPAWQADAACLDLDPDLFFPERSEHATAAKAVCATCPVTSECLDYALTTNQRFGVWGGTTERDRRRMRARARARGREAS